MLTNSLEVNNSQSPLSLYSFSGAREGTHKAGLCKKSGTIAILALPAVALPILSGLSLGSSLLMGSSLAIGSIAYKHFKERAARNKMSKQEWGMYCLRKMVREWLEDGKLIEIKRLEHTAKIVASYENEKLLLELSSELVKENQVNPAICLFEIACKLLNNNFCKNGDLENLVHITSVNLIFYYMQHADIAQEIKHINKIGNIEQMFAVYNLSLYKAYPGPIVCLYKTSLQFHIERQDEDRVLGIFKTSIRHLLNANCRIDLALSHLKNSSLDRLLLEQDYINEEESITKDVLNLFYRKVEAIHDAIGEYIGCDVISNIVSEFMDEDKENIEKLFFDMRDNEDLDHPYYKTNHYFETIHNPYYELLHKCFLSLPHPNKRLALLAREKIRNHSER